MYNSYPVGNDLVTLLTPLFSSATVALLDTESLVASGVESFEKAVGRKMLADGASVTMKYDPPTNYQDYYSTLFMDDFVSVSAVALVPNTGASTTFTLGVDYWLEPANARTLNQPYKRLRIRHGWSEPLAPMLIQALQVTGVRGYDTALPANVFRAMTLGAYDELHAELAHLASGGLLEWSEDDVKERYGDTPLNALLNGWKRTVDKAITTYRKVR